jgi:SAM-dependent methyltransferase
VCNDACVSFGMTHLLREDVRGKDLLEIGACNVNGSLRQAMLEREPTSYLGTDIAEGPGVDDVCNVVDLAARYGPNRFDVVICTEMLEHVRDWRAAVSNMKRVLRPGGVMLITTRAKGHPYHGYPFDYWRYELADFRHIFGDFEVLALEADPTAPGVFMKARKPAAFVERDLTTYELYSIVSKRSCRTIGNSDIALLRFRHATRNFLSAIVPSPMKALMRSVFPTISRVWRD